jgi:hypothetical protein
VQPYKQLLRQISTGDVTFISDINKEFFIDQSGKSNYYEIKFFEIEYFYNFVTNLSSNSLYTVIPLLSFNNNPDEPYMVLSKSILVTKYSSHRVIHHHVYAKYHKALEDLGIDSYKLEDYRIIFKYKKVTFDINQFNKKFGK